MNDMASVIVPKSDQINADDLIAGPRTIRITDVGIRPGTEQPVAIRYENDDGKPYKPCKSMCRIMVAAWGADAKTYVGKAMTLYRDPSVKWGGMEVGGIRISHMSDIERTLVMSLTATKGSRKPFTVKPLTDQPRTTPGPVASPSPAPSDFPGDQPSVPKIHTEARAKAKEGSAAFNRWWQSLPAKDQDTLDPIADELYQIGQMANARGAAA